MSSQQFHLIAPGGSESHAHNVPTAASSTSALIFRRIPTDLNQVTYSEFSWGTLDQNYKSFVSDSVIHQPDNLINTAGIGRPKQRCSKECRSRHRRRLRMIHTYYLQRMMRPRKALLLKRGSSLRKAASTAAVCVDFSIKFLFNARARDLWCLPLEHFFN